MNNSKTISLSKLNSLIKKEEDFSNEQKALLIVKGGLKAVSTKEEYTEEEVASVVAVRHAAEMAAAEKAMELDSDELFESYNSLAEAIEKSVEICFSVEADEPVIITEDDDEDDEMEEEEVGADEESE